MAQTHLFIILAGGAGWHIIQLPLKLHFLKKRRGDREIDIKRKWLNRHVVVCTQTRQRRSQGWFSIGHQTIGING